MTSEERRARRLDEARNAWWFLEWHRKGYVTKMNPTLELVPPAKAVLLDALEPGKLWAQLETVRTARACRCEHSFHVHAKTFTSQRCNVCACRGYRPLKAL